MPHAPLDMGITSELPLLTKTNIEESVYCGDMPNGPFDVSFTLPELPLFLLENGWTERQEWSVHRE